MFFKFQRLKYSWYFPTIMIVLVAVGVFSAIVVYWEIDHFEKQSLLRRSNTLSKVLASDQIDSLSGDISDLEKSQYKKLKEELVAVRSVNSDVRFIYLMGKRNEDVFIFADSEELNSRNHSAPGTVYFEASPPAKAIFETGEAFLEGPVSDRWGRWISAHSPIVDHLSGQTVAVVVMEIDAADYLKTVWVHTSIPPLVVIALLALTAMGWMAKKQEEKMMELKSEIVTIASHDLRSPLVGMLWSFEHYFLKFSGKIEQEQKKRLQLIEKDCRNLLNTLNDFLLVPSLDAKNAEEVLMQEENIVEPLKEAIENFAVMCEKKKSRIVFEKSFPSELKLKINREKIKRVFNNLLDNAVKYSKPDSAIKIGYQKKKKLHIFSIKDRGIGISAKDQSKIFNGFYRAENAKEFAKLGTGLGLFYVKRVIELHGGKVWVESQEGRGATFYVALK